jgi:glycine cleavage system H lipoate-binding protein
MIQDILTWILNKISDPNQVIGKIKDKIEIDKTKPELKKNTKLDNAEFTKSVNNIKTNFGGKLANVKEVLEDKYHALSKEHADKVDAYWDKVTENDKTASEQNRGYSKTTKIILTSVIIIVVGGLAYYYWDSIAALFTSSSPDPSGSGSSTSSKGKGISRVEPIPDTDSAIRNSSSKIREFVQPDPKDGMFKRVLKRTLSRYGPNIEIGDEKDDTVFDANDLDPGSPHSSTDSKTFFVDNTKDSNPKIEIAPKNTSDSDSGSGTEETGSDDSYETDNETPTPNTPKNERASTSQVRSFVLPYQPLVTEKFNAVKLLYENPIEGVKLEIWEQTKNHINHMKNIYEALVEVIDGQQVATPLLQRVSEEEIEFMISQMEAYLELKKQLQGSSTTISRMEFYKLADTLLDLNNINRRVQIGDRFSFDEIYHGISAR